MYRIAGEPGRRGRISSVEAERSRSVNTSEIPDPRAHEIARVRVNHGYHQPSVTFSFTFKCDK